VVTTVKSYTLVGIDAVDVEGTIDRGLQYRVVGLAAPAVKQGASRFHSALKTVV
jgi:hypothetical protein